MAVLLRFKSNPDSSDPCYLLDMQGSSAGMFNRALGSGSE